MLLDWSEKLDLEPNNSATAGTYCKIGVLVAVCVYKTVNAGVSESITAIGLCEKPTNDVPHTHAFLRKLLEDFASQSEAMGTKLQVVNVWSDGGPAHFKCGEAFCFCSHLLRELQDRCGQGARFVWNFMQSYHGKGPYDPEGGVVKYTIRRQILKQGFAFLCAWDVYIWVCANPAVTLANVTGAGVGRNKAFDITRRKFFYIPESDVDEFRFCTSPLFHTSGMAGEGLLKGKESVFCIVPDVNPAVTPLRLASPAHLGISAAEGRESITTPFAQATLNLIDVGFSGHWRRFSCSCRFCLFREGVCDSHGVGNVPPVWERYSVTRDAPLPGNASTHSTFIGCLVDGMLTTGRGQYLEVATKIAQFIRTYLHRFRSVEKALVFIKRRFALAYWVEAWATRLQSTPNAQLDIVAQAENLGWKVPVPDRKPAVSIADFVAALFP